MSKCGNSSSYRPACRRSLGSGWPLSSLFRLRTVLSLCVLILSAGYAAAADYELFGDISSALFLHPASASAGSGPLLAGTASVSADHRLTFDAGDFVAHQKLSFSSPGEMSLSVSEAYLNLFVSPSLSLSLGKQRISWGTGYTFSPADSLNPQSASLESLFPAYASEEGFVGTSLLFTPSANVSLSLNLSLDRALGADDAFYRGLSGGAFATFFIGSTVITPSLVYSPSETFRPGLSLSTGIAGVVLFFEGAAEFLNRAYYPEAAEDGSSGVGFTQAGEWKPYPLFTAGTEYSFGFNDGLVEFNLVGEYLYDGRGYDDPDAAALYDVLAALQSAGGDAGAAAAQTVGDGQPDLSAPGTLPQPLRKNYLAPVLTASVAGYLTLDNGALLGLDDGSGVVYHYLTVTALAGIDFTAGAYWFYGDAARSEFGLAAAGGIFPGRYAATLGATVHF